MDMRPGSGWILLGLLVLIAAVLFFIVRKRKMKVRRRLRSREERARNRSSDPGA